MEELSNIIESLLFVADEPLTVDRIRKIVQAADAQAVREAIGALSREYESRKGGFYLAEVAGGFQLRTRPEYNEYIKDMLQPSTPRLSKAALETLAIIAYKQPIIRADLEHIRGVDSGGVLRMLLKRKLIRVLGRKEIPGRPLIYATTKRFLEMFDLKDLKDLPTPREIEELGSEASDELAAAFEALDLPAEGPAPPQEERSLFEPASGEKKAAAPAEDAAAPEDAQAPEGPEFAPDAATEPGQEPENETGKDAPAAAPASAPGQDELQRTDNTEAFDSDPGASGSAQDGGPEGSQDADERQGGF